jgi:hypothetical protein
MNDERIDLSALDPWPSTERLQSASQALVQAHRGAMQRAPFSGLLVWLAPRAVLTAAVATALIWLLPGLLAPHPVPAGVPPTEAVAHSVVRGHLPTGRDLLALTKGSDED